jgi:hypothetical protein
MAVEIRRIIFSTEEFKAVTNIYMNLVGPTIGLAEGTVMNVGVLKDEPLEIRAHIQSRDGRQI